MKNTELEAELKQATEKLEAMEARHQEAESRLAVSEASVEELRGRLSRGGGGDEPNCGDTQGVPLGTADPMLASACHPFDNGPHAVASASTTSSSTVREDDDAFVLATAIAELESILDRNVESPAKLHEVFRDFQAPGSPSLEVKVTLFPVTCFVWNALEFSQTWRFASLARSISSPHRLFANCDGVIRVMPSVLLRSDSLVPTSVDSNGRIKRRTLRGNLFLGNFFSADCAPGC